MKNQRLTIRLDPRLGAQLARIAARQKRCRSEIARGMLRRQLARLELGDLRQRIAPLAQARGCLTEEDVIRKFF